MDRRFFLKGMFATGAGLAFGGHLVPPTASSAETASAPGAKVYVAKGPDPAKNVRTAVGMAGGMGSFVKPGAKVVVKPNIGWDRQPEHAADTAPEVVLETVKLCLEAGAAVVRVFDRPCNDPRRCYMNSGIAPALEKLGDKRVELSFIDDRRFRKVTIPGGVALPEWSFYEDALEADTFINLPIAKHHRAAVVTMAMKNMLGIAGANRAVLHKRIHEAVVDLNRVVKSHLTILDATRILVRNGPQGGDPKDAERRDTIIVGTDIVAVDAVGCTLFGVDPMTVGYLKLAHEAGMGTADLKSIDVAEA